MKGGSVGREGMSAVEEADKNCFFMVHILEAWWLPGCRYVVTAMELDVGLVVTVLFIILEYVAFKSDPKYMLFDCMPLCGDTHLQSSLCSPGRRQN